MRLLLLAALMLIGLGCDKTIHEVRAPLLPVQAAAIDFPALSR